MKNKILLGYLAVGPTFRKRVVTNIINYTSSYNFFDVLILTDNPLSREFDKIKEFKNVFIENISLYMEQHPEFFEYEKLQNPQISENEYKEGFQYKFPLNLQRYILKYKNIDKYNYIAMLDCDVIPRHNIEEFKEMYNFLENELSDNVVISHRAIYFYYEDFHREFLKKISQKLKISTKNFKKYQNWDNKESQLVTFDNPFKLFKITDFKKTKTLFDMWSTILLEMYCDTRARTSIVSGSWNYMVEGVMAYVYPFSGIELIPPGPHSHHIRKFMVYTYPEDRFWHNVVNAEGIDLSGNTQAEFIQNNRTFLKKFYQERGQKWTYE